MSRWAHWSNGTESKRKGFRTIMEAQGNPAVTAGSVKARAEAMGLQSDGKGGYIDPKTGQVVARTVNNELVFFDSGPSGGVVSDGGGGMALTQAQPSWADPQTGMLITPPGKPESPEEIAAVPDPIPAAPPAGYHAFINKGKRDAYRMQAMTPDPASENMGIEGAIEGGGMEGGMENDLGGGGMEGGMAENYTPADLAKRAAPEAPEPPMGAVDRARQNIQQFTQKAQMAQAQNEMPMGQPEMPERSPSAKQLASTYVNNREIHETRQKELSGMLDKMFDGSAAKTGAGALDMSKEDLTAFKNYLEKGPQSNRTPLTDEDKEYVRNWMEGDHLDLWRKNKNSLKGKGDPAPNLKTIDRAWDVLYSYLENHGTSAIDGSPLAFGDSELDHVMSLNNGGIDGGDNWAWLPRRFNQFKGALEDDALREKIDKYLERNPKDDELKALKNALKNDTRKDWGKHFRENGWDNVTAADVMGQKGDQGVQYIKALAEAAGINTYRSRGKGSRAGSDRAKGGGAIPTEELKQVLVDQLGLRTQQDIETWDQNTFDLLQRLEDARGDYEDKNIARKKEKAAERKAARQAKMEEFERGEITLEEYTQFIEQLVTEEAE